MNDISKLIQGKNLSELDIKILHYIIENIDDVLERGVREIAKDNFTSPSTIIRLSKKWATQVLLTCITNCYQWLRRQMITLQTMMKIF